MISRITSASFFFFFFSSRRRHTRSLCDWSSDVCSSDLGAWVGCHHVNQISVLLFHELSTLAVMTSCQSGNQTQRPSPNKLSRAREGIEHFIGELAAGAHRRVREI